MKLFNLICTKWCCNLLRFLYYELVSRASYSGITPPFQGGYTGSSPVARSKQTPQTEFFNRKHQSQKSTSRLGKAQNIW